MKIHRFIGDFDLAQEEIVLTERDVVKQIRNVLKLEAGEEILLSDGHGNEARCQIISIFSDKVICKIIENNKNEDNARKVSLYLAILKKDNFELAVQKATECGVSQIIPVITDRTIKTGLNTERLEKIVKEASEQSGRSVVPGILETMNFSQAIEHGKENTEKVIFHLGGEDYTLDGSKASVQQSVSIFIGPEGGFTDKEISLAQDSEYSVASLGALTLRGETAAIIATYRAANSI